MAKKPRKLKWKKTVIVVENGEMNQLCLACGNAFDVIAPCPPFPRSNTGSARIAEPKSSSASSSGKTRPSRTG